MIPFYNEEKRIGAVLSQVIKVKNLLEVIAVGDGSNDHGYELVKNKFPQVKLVSLTQNLGKTGAVKKGVDLAKGDYILLLDADLLGVKKEELEYLVGIIFQRPSIDMIILKRTHTPLGSRLVRSDLIFSGERILKKVDLEKILSFPITKYQLEIATNKYMKDKNKFVYWYQCSTKNTPKAEKIGFLRGYYDELKMKVNVISYDWQSYFWQILFFCRKQLSNQQE